MHRPDKLHACPSCSNLIRAQEMTCPHCGARGSARVGVAAVALGLALVACGDKDSGGDDSTVVALYGVADTSQIDADGDGWTAAEGDCDDNDDTIHPEAADTPDDGVDSDCDGTD